MAKFFGSTFAGVLDGAVPAKKANGAKSRSKLRTSVETFNMAAQPVGSQLAIGRLPIGGRFHSVREITDTSLGTTTLAFGSDAAPAKYAAAHTLTQTDTPISKTTVAGLTQDLLTAEEVVFATTAVAALPAAGKLVFELSWTEAA